jgi:hypothetical protein
MPTSESTLTAQQVNCAKASRTRGRVERGGAEGRGVGVKRRVNVHQQQLRAIARQGHGVGEPLARLPRDAAAKGAVERVQERLVATRPPRAHGGRPPRRPPLPDVAETSSFLMEFKKRMIAMPTIPPPTPSTPPQRLSRPRCRRRATCVHWSRTVRPTSRALRLRVRLLDPIAAFAIGDASIESKTQRMANVARYVSLCRRVECRVVVGCVCVLKWRFWLSWPNCDFKLRTPIAKHSSPPGSPRRQWTALESLDSSTYNNNDDDDNVTDEFC